MAFKFSLPSLPPTPPPHKLERPILINIAFVVLVAVIVHFAIADIFIASFTAFVYGLKSGIIVLRKPPLPKALIILLSIAGFALVLLMYGGWNGQKAGISYLVLLLSLKFLESTTLRDYYIVCLISYFLTATTFLFNTSMLTISAVILYSVSITALLVRLSNPTAPPWLQSIKQASWIIIKALPVAVLLFFFFPRIQGDFGFLPSQDSGSQISKINNSLVAGDFAKSAFSNALAFRVEFDGSIPPNYLLYWRSKVMTIEKEFQWFLTERTASSLRHIQNSHPTGAAQQSTGLISYRILHEKSSDNFIPYLDYVTQASLGNILSDSSVYRFKPAFKPFAYQGRSDLSSSTLGKPDPRLLVTQTRPTARTLALLTQWQTSAAGNQDKLVESVYQYFKQANFRYSLTPPSLGDNAFDDFLFNKRVGYCEHYASAFTSIIRWLGIPARVVVGFQGGRSNKTGNYLEVRYSDAHAWSEVWLNQRWVRVDPTAAISPERIEYGMDAFRTLLESGNWQDDLAGGKLADYLAPKGIDKLVRYWRDNMSNLGYQWNKWVVNYDIDKQRELLKQLGFEKQNSLYTLVTLLFMSITVFLLFYFWQLVPKPVKLDEAQKWYLQFTNKFKKYNIIKEPSDTPSLFYQKAVSHFPEFDAELKAITQLYIDIRYGRPEENDIKRFKQSVKRFKIS